MAQRYLARRVHGDGTETPLGEIDFLAVPTITDVISGPPSATGTISPETRDLVATDGPLFIEWNTAIVADSDGDIHGAWLVAGITENEDTYELDLVGYTTYPNDQPYTGATYFVETDPADIFRHIWEHLRGLPGGNLGITIDPLQTPVRIGKELEEVKFNAETSPGVTEQVSFEAGPFKLNWYDTDDLGGKIDDLAEEGGFDWHEKHWWDGENVVHHIELGYPRIGRRRTDQWLEIGANCAVTPVVSRDGNDYANTVIVLGAGEGSAAIRGTSANQVVGVRRAVVLEDKSIKSQRAANELANREVAIRQDVMEVDSITAWDHPNLPVREARVGDELRLFGKTAWRADLDIWVRIITITRNPDVDDTIVLTVERADRGVQ